MPSYIRFYRPEIDAQEFEAHKIRDHKYSVDHEKEEQHPDQGPQIQYLPQFGRTLSAQLQPLFPNVAMREIEVSNKSGKIKKLLEST
ncbi:MAG: hypothetical protein H6558_05210 [Lewinellaceae bacterium]|nr:hypothetical protein [Lewinellaceae bacterium]